LRNPVCVYSTAKKGLGGLGNLERTASADALTMVIASELANHSKQWTPHTRAAPVFHLRLSTTASSCGVDVAEGPRSVHCFGPSISPTSILGIPKPRLGQSQLRYPSAQ
jgi:hypothetical protein